MNSTIYPQAALVITTYNNPEFLGICLRSFANQTVKDFDIFIADDGSTQETRDKIHSLRKYFSRELHHHWHADTGYNKSKINNDVFRELGNYSIVICVDGDTIAHYRFIEDHLTIHAQHERLLFMGRRIDLGERASAAINEENVESFNRGISWTLLSSVLSGETQNLSRAFHITQPWLQHLLRRDHVRDLLGSNFSISRPLLYEVNGYNEDYRSYWGEDGDLFIRIRNSGATIVGLKSYAIQYHLYHDRRIPTAEHEALYQKLLANTSYQRCPNGIAKNST